MKTKTTPKRYTDKSGDVLQAEENYLFDGQNGRRIGLAISGGGIRSASFALGVMQGLVAKGIMKKVNYMSTVSGGGFIGSALTWALNQNKEAGLEAHNFPLGQKEHLGKKGPLDKEGKNFMINFLRQHGNYLMPSHSLGVFSFAAVVLRGLTISLFVYSGLLTMIMIIFKWLKLFETGEASLFHQLLLNPCCAENSIPSYLSFLNCYNAFQVTAGFLLGLSLLLYFIYSIRSAIPENWFETNKYQGFLIGQTILGYLWKYGGTFFILGSIPYVLCQLQGFEIPTITGATLTGVATGIWQYVKAQNNDNSSGILTDIAIYIGAALLLFGLLIGSYALASSNLFFDHSGALQLIPCISLLGVVLFFGLFSNLNLLGPHRIWRNRLMETYMPTKNAIRDNKWDKSSGANRARMESMCDDLKKMPYHIVNTNSILVDSKKSQFRNRGGDNFIISPLYCGSDATGWLNTKDYQPNRGGITLATAMAASGAALNPNAGVSGEGMPRNTVVSMLLSVLNLGLGYWAENPKKYGTHSTPNLFFPGIKRLFAEGLSEDANLIQLSDGGHFDNTGLYELVRRETDVIILSDAGADTAYNFDDFGNAIERIRVDFGTTIKFKQKGYGIDQLMPGSYYKSKKNNDEDPYDRSENGFAIGEISYPGKKKKGILILIKPTMIHPLATDVYSYKGIHSDFPQQTTADQFYDEKQFEAYRELGSSITWYMGKAIEAMLKPTGNTKKDEKNSKSEKKVSKESNDFPAVLSWFKKQFNE